MQSAELGDLRPVEQRSSSRPEVPRQERLLVR